MEQELINFFKGLIVMFRLCLLVTTQFCHFVVQIQPGTGVKKLVWLWCPISFLTIFKVLIEFVTILLLFYGLVFW